MVKKKIGPGIILAAFIVIICFSWLFWFFLGKYADSTNYENRELAVKPKLTIDNYGTFFEEYDSYFNDNIPFRNNLITINTAIDYFLFNISTNENVVAGNNNWLFYSRVDDGDPISCYQGTNLLTDEELSVIANNCMSQRDFLAKQGTEFVIFIAPNKERIYYENMPAYYGLPAENYKAKQIVEYLHANTDLRVIYPYEDLMQTKEAIEENIYYKTDTHWNSIGGYIGASALLKELGIDMPAIYDPRISINPGKKLSGDLAAMLNLSRQLRSKDTEYSVSGYNTHNLEVVEEDFFNAFIYHAENADPRKIYICRDSFATAMARYIGSQFTDSYLRHAASYSYGDYLAQAPDIFVYEVVERSVGNLGTFSVQKAD